ncbi:MAG: hypothetical protein AVDCRST_MAG86-1937 [uncultured Truepera sp.]|uniref:Sucraseferredoxin family protein n=1 Tax=uncultured Truepera sp. TaxID=543023 RepID=A0A6J4VDX7_9DEIN|nr:MAG: hypothetical protein AVDCRST_MAG86-1937 [uncultured Truepera sp.]
MPRTADLTFCNLQARAGGLDPVGHAGTVDLLVAFELPLPWPYGLWGCAGMPPEVRDLIALWYGDADVPRPQLRPLVMAPDPTYSAPGLRRMLVYRRPEGKFADLSQTEYLVPEGELGRLVWAAVLEPEKLPAFAQYALPETPGTRDLFVCTHGAVDAACAKFGFPLYRQLREAAGAGVRVWRASHFGGHVFAPTLAELPSGRFWGYLDGDAPAALLSQEGAVGDLYSRYRGWSALTTPFLQAAEREVLRLEGWPWLGVAKQGETLSEGSGWAEVRLSYRRPDGYEGAYHARVQLAAPVETPHDSGGKLHSYRQYKVVKLAKGA